MAIRRPHALVVVCHLDAEYGNVVLTASVARLIETCAHIRVFIDQTFR